MQIFRSFSPALQVIMFTLMVYFMAGVGEIIYSIVLSLFADNDLTKLNWKDARIVISHAFFFQIFAFLLAFMLFLRYSGERFTDIVAIQKINTRGVLITVMVFFGAVALMPIIELISQPLTNLLPPEVITNEKLFDQNQQNLIYQSNPIQFAFTLLTMAVLPAICEELVFRGLLISKIVQSGGHPRIAVILSALIFAGVHFQPLKFIPMVFLGLCLGYIYTYLKNIKYAMLFHFLINASQIIAGFLIASDF